MSTNTGSIVINLNNNITVNVPTKLDIIKVGIKKSNDDSITNEYYIFLDYNTEINSIACISIEKKDNTSIEKVELELQKLKKNEFPYVSDPDNKYTFDFILLPCDNLESIEIVVAATKGGKYKRKQNTQEKINNFIKLQKLFINQIKSKLFS